MSFIGSTGSVTGSTSSLGFSTGFFTGSIGSLGISSTTTTPSDPEYLENYRLEALRIRSLRDRVNISATPSLGFSSAFRDHVFSRENVQQEIETPNGIVYSRDPEYKQALRDLISGIFLVHEPLR